MSERVMPVTAIQKRKAPLSAKTETSTNTNKFDQVLTVARGINRMINPTSTTATPSPKHIVSRGETLSGICEKALRAQGLNTSPTSVAAAVNRTAQANKLKSANIIQVGQIIDLTTIAPTTDTNTKTASQTPTPTPLTVSAQVSIKTPTTQTVNASNTAKGGRPHTVEPATSELLALFETIRARAQKSTSSSADKNQIELASVVKSDFEISSDYGLRQNPFTGQLEHHDGIDLAAKTGTTITAPIEGTVVFSGWQPGYGKTVILRHDNGLETLYAHNQTNLVEVGTKVPADTPLAQIGSTGYSTGPHVHFEIRRDGRAIDPALTVKRPTSASMQIAKAF